VPEPSTQILLVAAAIVWRFCATACGSLRGPHAATSLGA
jgi:hypothetical protein